MRGTWRLALALAFVGVVAAAAAAFGQTAPSPSPDAPERPGGPRARCRAAAQAEQDDPKACPRFRPGGRIVHGEMLVQTRDGFATMIVDHGTVTAVDAAARTVTIERADGEPVTVTGDDRTRVRKNRKQADFGVIEVGDLARLVRFDAGDGTLLRLVAVADPDAGQGTAGPGAQIPGGAEAALLSL